ncbi:phospholipase [Parasphingorhabdus pacifica]
MARSASRRFHPLAGALTAATALLLAAGTAHADFDPDDLEEITDEYLFDYSLPRFAATRAQRPHADRLDWSSDGCSLSPDEPFGYEFTDSCHRHDFGYRNYTVQQRFTEENRLDIDDNFRSDMHSICAGAEPLCHGTAEVYYWAVREFGGVATSTAEAIEQAEIRPVTDRAGRQVAWDATDRNGDVVHFRLPH